MTFEIFPICGLAACPYRLPSSLFPAAGFELFADAGVVFGLRFISGDDGGHSCARGAFFLRGMVILDEDEQTACLSLGFRKWAAQAVPLEMHRGIDGRFYFVVPTVAAVTQVQRPHWLMNHSADAEATRWKACCIRVKHPACLESRFRKFSCVLEQCSEIEPLVKDALRSGR